MFMALSSLSFPAAAAPGLLLAADGAGFNLWATFMNAEIFGKSIVILLMFFSLLAWTVMISKHLDLTKWRRVNLDFQTRLRDTEMLMQQTVSTGLRQSVPYARLFHDAIEAARQHAADRDPAVRLGLIENALQRGVGMECVRYERKMVLLGSLVSGAPFMGLLGTVVGVMVAFNGMGQSSGMSLQNIAPGVASALLATVCGLLVAIPSVFGYNFLLSQVKIMITELENFASWLADRMELEMEAQKITPSPGAHPVEQMAPPPAPKPSAASNSPGAERYLRLDVSEQD
jgi:biopolymer transport protein TolQ